MNSITLDDDQVKSLPAGSGTVEIRDRSGNLLGYMARNPGDEAVAEAKRRLASDGPWYSTQQVLDHLDNLE